MGKRLEWTKYSKNAKQIFNKHMQKCPTLSVIMEMQIKATRRKYPTVTRTAKTKKIDDAKFWRRHGIPENSRLLVEMENSTSHLEKYLTVS